jgi:hypothetical protein
MRPTGLDTSGEWMGGKEALIMFGVNVLLILVTMILSKMIPAAPATNRKMAIANSRFLKTPLPGTPVSVN